MTTPLAHTATRSWTLLASLIGLALAWPVSGLACATCFGASDDKMAQGMNMGILALLVVVVGVLAGLLTAGIVIVQRTRRCQDEEAEASAPSEAPGRPEECP
jgi:hypothetical protein